MSSTPSNPAPGPTPAPDPTPGTDPILEIPPLRGEAALLAEVQKKLLKIPVSVPVATALSHFGEHALGWMAICATGAVTQPQHRRAWITTGAAAFGAHAASVVIKRVVRRKRPNHPTIAIGVKTPSKLSFPSSHATSTTAFALLAGQATGIPGAATAVPATLVPIMAASRLVLGVHYPSDVVGGAVLGAASAALARQYVPRALDTAATWVQQVEAKRMRSER